MFVLSSSLRIQFSSVQSLSPVRLCDRMDCSKPGLPVHHQLLEPIHTHIHHVSDAIQPYHPLSSPSPTFNFPSMRVFFNESVLLIMWPKYWSFSFSISLSSEYSGLISFRIDQFDFLAVQELSRVFSNTTVQKHQFFRAQLSLQSNSHIQRRLQEKSTKVDLCWQSNVSAF